MARRRELLERLAAALEEEDPDLGAVTGRGPTQAFGGRVAGRSAILLGASGAANTPIGTPGQREFFAQVGGLGSVRPWNVFARALSTFPTPAGGVPVALAAAVMHLRWTVDGAIQEAEVDVGTGSRLTLVADAVSLDIQNESGTGAGVGLGDPRLMCHGMIAPYDASSPIAATRTRYIGAIMVGGSATVPIPPFARTAIIELAPGPGTGSTSAEFLDSAGNVVATWGLAGAGTDFSNPMRVPNDARSVRINSIATARTSVRVVFDLCL